MSNLKDVAEYLFHRRAKGLPSEALAEILDRLVWCMDDNGTDVSLLQREWLRSDDQEKVKIALAMSQTIPYPTEAEVKGSIREVTSKWPDLKEEAERVCSEWLRAMRGQVFGDHGKERNG